MESSHERDARLSFERALRAARQVWGADWEPTRAAVAPGRIEILGNHTDYNGGPVLAAAIDRATVILADDSDELSFHFADVPELGVVEFDLDVSNLAPISPGSPVPADYVLGTVARSRVNGRTIRPGRAVVATSVPIGSGMSSSAALCVATTLILNESPPARAELVYDAQAAENWTGVPCGTMDQSASVFGQVIRFAGPEGTTSIGPELGEYCFVVVDSRVERTLGTSSYPTRVRECGEAVALLESYWGRQLGTLSAVTSADLAGLDPGVLPVPLDARVRHIVTEINRVALGEDAMRAQDWQRFGALMYESGRSSAGDYAISHPRVEELVATMNSVPGVLGARMMGGGEGGATLALLRRDALDDLRIAVAAYFADQAAGDAIVPLSFAPGARVLSKREVARLTQ
jgi:galactokinase